ncbi:MAG TPA: 4-hydroxy-tetrahydrodipicolinate synthase [Kofleriaceae bacterium]|nr:4-hydroxy-tetrahydrodipicolinate synthase [Kofleriaceae bacterium]
MPTRRGSTFEGVITALVTPMRDGQVDAPALARLVEEQISAGVDGLVAVGTTGESATLTVAEHVAVIRHVVEVARKRVPVLAGAGANSTAEAIELSVASQEAGADGLLHVTPYYNKPTQEGLYRHFAAIARETPLPIVLYNVPGRTACDMLPETVARLAEIDRVVAIKEATGDMRRAAEVIAAAGDRITVLSGDDFTAYGLMALGGRGVISVVSNVVPGRMAAMWDAAARGDWDGARAIHFELMPLMGLLFVEPNPIPVKAALELMGVIGGEIRLPLCPCAPALRARIADDLKGRGLL